MPSTASIMARHHPLSLPLNASCWSPGLDITSNLLISFDSDSKVKNLISSRFNKLAALLFSSIMNHIMSRHHGLVDLMLMLIVVDVVYYSRYMW